MMLGGTLRRDSRQATLGARREQDASRSMVLTETWRVLKQAGSEWVDDKCSQLGAALAFYCILSLAPLLVISIAIAGFVFGERAARGELVEQIQQTVGKQGAEVIQTVLANAHQPSAGILATVLGVAILVVGASGVFNQLRDSLNTVWDIEPPAQRGVWRVWPFIRDRLLPFLLVLGTGFLLLLSLVISEVMAGAAHYLEARVHVAEAVWHVVNVGVSFVMVFLLFALIYKVLPAARVAWRDVWLGALITAVLFMVGKLLLGLYLGKSSVGSAYGAAGSLVVLLVWIYYAAQILFFGAELTHVCAQRYRKQHADQPPPGTPGTDKCRTSTRKVAGGMARRPA
jgi:membrane protein